MHRKQPRISNSGAVAWKGRRNTSLKTLMDRTKQNINITHIPQQKCPEQPPLIQPASPNANGSSAIHLDGITAQL